MEKEKKICRYKNESTDWKCPYEALEDSKEGFCIFHERRKDKDINKFNEGIKRILGDKDSDAYHFDGFYFPKSISFKGFEFKKDVFFTTAEFSGEYTNFSGAKFSGGYTNFNLANFSGEYTDFAEANFPAGNAYFGGAKFSGVTIYFTSANFSCQNTDFNGASFLAKNIYFSEAKFSRGKTDFSRAEFSGEKVDFSMAIFSGEKTLFNGAKFSGEETNFREAKFLGESTDFEGAEFSGIEVKFYYANFFKRIVFDRVIFKAKTNFTGVDLSKCVFSEVDLKNVDFNLLEWDWKRKLGNETELEKILEGLWEKKHQFYFKTSEIYRQLKVQFHNKRDFAKAGMFHFREQECKRMACKLPKDFFKWIFLWILKVSCGYGEKLRNVGLSSVALVLIFGIIYMFLGLHATDQNEGLILQYKIAFKDTTPIWTIVNDFGKSLSFSIKGFFPLWRFQQYKVVGDFANLVAGIEFLLGAFMVGLFVYVFRRRMEK